MYTCKYSKMYSYSLATPYYLCFQEFHLEYDKLDERPHVPSTFNYNPAQQAFWLALPLPCPPAIGPPGSSIVTTPGSFRLNLTNKDLGQWSTLWLPLLQIDNFNFFLYLIFFLLFLFPPIPRQFRFVLRRSVDMSTWSVVRLSILSDEFDYFCLEQFLKRTRF